MLNQNKLFYFFLITELNFIPFISFSILLLMRHSITSSVQKTTHKSITNSTLYLYNPLLKNYWERSRYRLVSLMRSKKTNSDSPNKKRIRVIWPITQKLLTKMKWGTKKITTLKKNILRRNWKLFSWNPTRRNSP